MTYRLTLEREQEIRRISNLTDIETESPLKVVKELLAEIDTLREQVAFLKKGSSIQNLIEQTNLQILIAEQQDTIDAFKAFTKKT